MLDHRLVTGNSNQPVLVRDEWHYHCGDSDRCQKIYGVATLLNSKTSHISRMSQEQRESQYSPLGQALFSRNAQMRLDPDDSSKLMLFFPDMESLNGVCNSIYPVINRRMPFVQVVELCLHGRPESVDTVPMAALREFYRVNSIGKYRTIKEVELLADFFEAVQTGQPFSVVDHERDIGLYTTNNKSSGIQTFEWLGQSMAPGFNDDDYIKYCAPIEKHGYVEDHEWHGRQLTKEGPRIWQRGDVELAWLEYELPTPSRVLVRIVKGKELKILG
ncbi:MAG: hypothetical protein AAGD09_03325 [Cyanobacteria bacterium P01_F01_bin.56]